MAPALGQVARDLREAEQLARAVAQGGDDDVGPEPRAVLADAPAFVLEAAFARGDVQLVVGRAALGAIRRIEARKVRR